VSLRACVEYPGAISLSVWSACVWSACERFESLCGGARRGGFTVCVAVCVELGAILLCVWRVR
jgi:hypothetical protein